MLKETRHTKICWSAYITVDWNLIYLNQCAVNHSQKTWRNDEHCLDPMTVYHCHTLVSTCFLRTWRNWRIGSAHIHCQVDFVSLNYCRAWINPSWLTLWWNECGVFPQAVTVPPPHRWSLPAKRSKLVFLCSHMTCDAEDCIQIQKLV